MARLLWTLKQHVGPAPRVNVMMAFDSVRARTILFGGGTFSGTPFGDTWSWDGESWTQVDDLGPSARVSAAIAYDATRNRVVLFGGFINGVGDLGDTWEWNGEDWTQVADSGPPPRSGHKLAFDSGRNRIVLFGGEAAGAALNDTWEFDGNEWVQVEDIGPAARSGHGMVFDSSRGRIVLFGGSAGANVFGDTWEFDGTAWTQAAEFGPPPSIGATMVFNGRRSLLFGGAAASSPTAELFGKTWEWDGRHWTARQDIGPSGRWAHAMVYDASRNRGVLFGGSPSAPGSVSPILSGETWEQFEQGATNSEPPATGVSIQSLTASPTSAAEGQPVQIVATLSGTPPTGAQVDFQLANDAGVTIAELSVPGPFGGPPVASFGPLFLPAGGYNVTATLGSSTQTTALQITPSANLVQSLLAGTTNVPAGGNFTLTATVANAVTPPGLTVPLMVSVQGQNQLWLTPTLEIPSGQTVGTLVITASIFGPNASSLGLITFTATLGGANQNASVTLS